MPNTKSDFTLLVRLFTQPQDVEHISEKAIRLKLSCGDFVLPKSQILVDNNGEIMIPLWLLRDFEDSPCISAGAKFWLNKSTGEITPKKNGNPKN